ncbi:glutathione transferase GST 23-like [Salvia hispanica]|uniref:glutathione transferase GST 23-like n=1 Tax=Salvia hispanica TaxID=49212 RepID=UPI002009D8C9|nr:glutathione transferase GST 23-like [Salvia hispanica]
MAEAEELKLFRTWSSRYALRAVLALKIKGVDYQTVFEDLKNKSASLLQYNPIHKKVPVLLHNGQPICESLVILEYIDGVWKQPPLLPEHPYDRAMARFWAKFGDEKVMPSLRSVFLSQGEVQEEAVGSWMENLKLLEELLEGKKFFGGERIGYLDIALGWMANLISIYEEIIEMKLVDAEKFPLLSAWMRNLSDDPVIRECWPPRHKMVEKYVAVREAQLSST